MVVDAEFTEVIRGVQCEAKQKLDLSQTLGLYWDFSDFAESHDRT